MKSTLNVGYWSENCEDWFQRRLKSIRSGEGTQKTAGKWTSDLKRFGKSPKIVARARSLASHQLSSRSRRWVLLIVDIRTSLLYIVLWVYELIFIEWDALIRLCDWLSCGMYDGHVMAVRWVCDGHAMNACSSHAGVVDRENIVYTDNRIQRHILIDTVSVDYYGNLAYTQNVIKHYTIYYSQSVNDNGAVVIIFSASLDCTVSNTLSDYFRPAPLYTVSSFCLSTMLCTKNGVLPCI
jgi:hypothetical protein